MTSFCIGPVPRVPETFVPTLTIESASTGNAAEYYLGEMLKNGILLFDVFHATKL